MVLTRYEIKPTGGEGRSISKSLQPQTITTTDSTPLEDDRPPDLIILKLLKDERGVLSLTGMTEPGARVFVDGIEIPVSPSGLFSRPDIDFVKDREPFIEAVDASGNTNRFALRVSGTRAEFSDSAFMSAVSAPASITFDRAAADADPTRDVSIKVTLLDKEQKPVPQRNVTLSARSSIYGRVSGQNYNISGLDGRFTFGFTPSGRPGVSNVDIVDGVSRQFLGTVLVQLNDIAPAPPASFIVSADQALDDVMNISYAVVQPEIDFAGVHLYRDGTLIGAYTSTSQTIVDNLGTGVDGTDFTYEIRTYDQADPNVLESSGLTVTVAAEDHLAPTLSQSLVFAQPDKRHVDIDFSEPLFSGMTGVFTLISSSGISGPDPTPPGFSFEQFITTTKIRIVATEDMQNLTTYQIRVAGVEDDASPAHNQIIPTTLNIAAVF